MNGKLFNERGTMPYCFKAKTLLNIRITQSPAITRTIKSNCFFNSIKTAITHIVSESQHQSISFSDYGAAFLK